MGVNFEAAKRDVDNFADGGLLADLLVSSGKATVSENSKTKDF